jgi:tRNA(fMet)-specific endonuclease VapC
MSDLRYVLDANILSAYLKRETLVGQRMVTARQQDALLLLCPVVYYEVYRGLLQRDAQKQLAFFLRLVDTFTWDEFNRQDWGQAAQLWADLQRQGQPLPDADLLIGAYALRRDAIIVTDNTRHFARLGASLENWRRE